MRERERERERERREEKRRVIPLYHTIMAIPPLLYHRGSYCEQVGMQGEFDQYVLAEQYSTVLCHSNATVS